MEYKPNLRSGLSGNKLTLDLSYYSDDITVETLQGMLGHADDEEIIEALKIILDYMGEPVE